MVNLGYVEGIFLISNKKIKDTSTKTTEYKD